MANDKTDVVDRTTTDDVAKTLDAEIKKNGGLSGDLEAYKVLRPYVCGMVAEDVNHRFVSRIASKIAPYLQSLMQGTEASDTVAAAVQQYYVDEDARKFGVLEKEDDGEVEIVNADFSLAYGRHAPRSRIPTSACLRATDMASAAETALGSPRS